MTSLGGMFRTTYPVEVSNPIIQPPLPYMGKIPGGLKPNMAIFFQGAVPADAKLFDINFQTGQTSSDDIALQFGPRITAQQIYLNTFKNGIWEKNESVDNKPFIKGQSFNILMIIKSEGYEIYVNGFQILTYKHRVPLELVSTLGIRGDVHMTICGYINNWSSTTICSDILKNKGMGTLFPTMLPVPSQIFNPVFQPKLPYFALISGGLRPGMALYVQGAVNSDAKQFAIKLQSGRTNTDKVDHVAFLFNPRIGQSISMNSCSNGNWQKEELLTEKFFTRGLTFTAMIVIKPEGFEVYLNGVKQYLFSHQISFDLVTSLSITDDISLHFLGFIYDWSRSSFNADQFKLAGTGGVLPMISEVLNPVIQPKIPYVGTIPGGMKPGMVLYARGSVPAEATQFAINLQMGQNVTDDVAFSLKSQFGQYLSLNTFQTNTWNKEELVYSAPFIKGATFILFVVATSEGYEVYVNSMKQCMFKHRLPLEKVTALSIWGDVSINFYGFIENWSKSPFFTTQPKIEATADTFSKVFPVPTEISSPTIQPKIPYVAPIGGLSVGMALYIEGTVPANASQFGINLQAGQKNTDDVPFSIKFLLGQYTCLLTLKDDMWLERSRSNTPTTKGTAFSLLVAINSGEYEVFLNGSRHSTLKHYIPLERVNTLNIWGDVSINFFGLIDSWKRSSIFTEPPRITDVGTIFTSPLPIPTDVPCAFIQPPLPFIGELYGGIKPGMAIHIQGVIPSNANSFEMGLMDFSLVDTAFYYKPRFGQNIYLNSFTNGNWNKEENAPEHPLIRGGSFAMNVVINKDGYEVIVNGYTQCSYKHRLLYGNVYFLTIRGDVSINVAYLVQDWVKASSIMDPASITTYFPKVLSIPPKLSQPVLQPAPSYARDFKVQLKQDMAVYLHGIISSNALSLKINFQTGQSSSDDIAFCFNYLFGRYPSKNSFRNGSWEKEEIEFKNSLCRGEAFYMFVVINLACYEVYLNGVRFCTFKHRIPIEKVSSVSIRGDVSNPVCSIIDNWSRFPFCTDQIKIRGLGSLGRSFSSLFTIPTELSHLVLQPALPHLAKIPPVGIKTDMAVYFQGTVPLQAQTFEINFQVGTRDASNIALQFRPVFGKFVYLNSCKNNTWEKEETASIQPFTRGAAFSIYFVIKPDGFQIYVNDTLQCLFKHRVSIESISVISIYGDVSVTMYGLIESWSKSSFITDQSKITGKKSQSLLPPSSEILNPVYQPVIPYVGTIPGGIKSEQAVYFQGTVPKEAKSFEISLQTGLADGSDIAFYLNPRFGQCTAFNSFKNGAWDKEETVSDKPFVNGATFIMFVVAKSEGCEIYVNSVKIGSFKHRIPMEKITTLVVRGDVSLSVFGVIDNWKSSSFFLDEQKISVIGCPPSALMPKLSEISQHIIIPTLPYRADIPGGINSDMAMYFQGAIPADAKEFSIHLQSNINDMSEIIFCFNPRIGQNTRLNTFKFNSWGVDQIESDKPFAKETSFIMFLVITANGYEVYVNGQKHSTFMHRMSMSYVGAFRILGDVCLNVCGFVNNWSNSSCCKELKKISEVSILPIPSEVSYPITNPTLPFLGNIPVPVKQDMAVFFQVVIPADANRFEINFQLGPSAGDDIAFHYNPRVGRYTALNSFKSGSWQKEESATDKPYTSGACFNIFMAIRSNGYEVSVNGQKHCTYNHRVPFEKVTTIRVSGDVSVTSIAFADNWSLPVQDA